MKDNRLDERDLEQILQRADQLAIRKVVQTMPEDTVSMVWRSELNEKLKAVAVQKKPAIWNRIWLRPAFGLACAGALAVMGMVLLRPASRPISAKSEAIESQLVALHSEYVQISEFSDPVLAFEDTSSSVGSGTSAKTELQDGDLEPL